MERRENGVVRKSNELVEARFRFSIWSMRVLLKVISLIDSEDEDFKTYNVYVGELVKDYNLQSFGDAYTLLKEGAEDMVGKTIDIPVLVGDKLEYGKVTMISSSIPKMDESKSRYIQVRFDPEIKPHLLKLKSKFLQYDIRNVLKLQSVHSVRIYELLKQYEKIGTRRFDVQDLKDTLGLYDENGKPQYPLYANFKQRVIDKAQKDLATHTDISFTYEEIKRGKAVHELIFHIAANRHRVGEEEGPESRGAARRKPSRPHPLFLELEAVVVKNWGVTANTLASLLEKYSEGQIRQAIEVTARAKKAGKVKDNVAGFFVDAVKKGYSDARLNADTKKKAATDVAVQIRKAEAELMELEDGFAQQVNDRVRSMVEADESIRDLAIEKVALEMEGYIKLKYKSRSALTTDNFRKDPVLRAGVLNAIVEEQRPNFADLEAAFFPKIETLKKTIAGLKA